MATKAGVPPGISPINAVVTNGIKSESIVPPLPIFTTVFNAGRSITVMLNVALALTPS
jgi:hypothetical protein